VGAVSTEPSSAQAAFASIEDSFMHRYRKYALSVVFLVLATPVLIAQSKDQQPVRHLTSWTADRREFAVGDIITVLVSDVTLASATKSQSGSDQQSRKNGIDVEPPKVGESSLPAINGSFSTDKNAASKQTGDAKRNLSFQGDISVRVLSVDKNGLLQIKGSKVVDVDKNKQTLNCTGWVRPEDISATNIVASERVADVSLTYQLSGALGKTRGGIVGRLINVFWP
jgi:flagellar L-ring protein precursor FlgH